MRFLKICIFCIVFLALGITLVNVADLQKANTNLNNQLQQQEQMYSGKIDELTVYQEKLVERISLLEENYQKLQTAYDELKAAYDQYLLDSTLEREQLQTTVTSLNATIVELEQNSDVDAETITALRSEVSTLETSLENQTTTVNQLQATVTQQEATIAELNVRIDELVEELNSDLSGEGGLYRDIFFGTVTELKAEDFGEITELRPYAFYNCENLVSVELPEYMSMIGESAFANCYNLIDVVLPRELISIEDAAFFDCRSLRNIEFPESLGIIGINAFFRCKSLTSLVFYENTILIDTTAFVRCENLETVIFNNTNMEWPLEILGCAFNLCTNLKNVYISSLENLSVCTPGAHVSISPFSSCPSLVIYTGSEENPEWLFEYWNYVSDTQAAPVNYGYTYEQFMEAISA